MKAVNFNNLLIISFICFFFLGCSSTQFVDISKGNQLDDLLDNIGQVELKINANEEVKQLIIKSIVSLDSDIKINFVNSIDNGVLTISNNFLNQEFAYFCKPASAYLAEVTEQYLFDFQKDDEVFIFYSERFKSQAETIKNISILLQKISQIDLSLKAENFTNTAYLFSIRIAGILILLQY